MRAEQWEEHNRLLERDGEFTLPWTRQAFEWLLQRSPRPPANVVDVGCGPAVATCLFAELSPDTQVTGVDATAAFLRRGSARVARMGLSGRVHLLEGDLGEGLDVATADLVWAAHVIHHLPDPVTGLAELARITAPGGTVAVVEGGLPMRVLPAGYGVATPAFVSRLEAALSDYSIETYDLPERVTSGADDWPALIAMAGLTHVESRTFLLDLPAPLAPTVRAYLVEKFTETRDLISSRLDPADSRALARLVDPADPRSLQQRPDLHVLAAHTVHLARH